MHGVSLGCTKATSREASGTTSLHNPAERSINLPSSNVNILLHKGSTKGRCGKATLNISPLRSMNCSTVCSTQDTPETQNPGEWGCIQGLGEHPPPQKKHSSIAGLTHTQYFGVPFIGEMTTFVFPINESLSMTAFLNPKAVSNSTRAATMESALQYTNTNKRWMLLSEFIEGVCKTQKIFVPFYPKWKAYFHEIPAFEGRNRWIRIKKMLKRL